MDAVSSEAKRRNQMLDVDSLDVEALKALLLAKQTEIERAVWAIARCLRSVT